MITYSALAHSSTVHSSTVHSSLAHSATAYSPAAWTSFGATVATATATLAGLLFVAVSINLNRILQFPSLPARAGQTLILFSTPLVTALLLIVPGQPRAALSAELIVLGVGIGFYQLRLDLGAGQSEYETRASRLLIRLAPPVINCGCMVVAGATLLAQAGGGLYWLVPGALAAIVAGLVNVWVLMVEILR
jgi:hypothetical protein